MLRKPRIMHIPLVLIALVLTACPVPPEPEREIATDPFFWGHWLRMDQEDLWYVGASKLFQGSAERAIDEASATKIVAGTMNLEKQSDNVLKMNNGAYYLYRSKGAQGRITGTVVAQGSAGRGLGIGISSVSLMVSNVKNALNKKTLDVNADGSFAMDSIVPTDSYEIKATVTKSDGTKEAGPTLTVKLQSMVEDIGTIQLVKVAYNFKVAVELPSGYLYADGSSIPVTVKVRNIGTADSKGASFELPAQSGFTATSAADPILGTIKPETEKSFMANLSCSSISGEYEDKTLKVAISDAYGNVWNDSVSIRFYKKQMSYAIASLNNPVFGVVMTPEREGYWFTTLLASGSLYQATVKLPWRDRGYLLALSRATVATESRYSVGIDVAAGSEAEMLALTKTTAFEPNDLETQAAGIAQGEAIVAYLHDEDIDFYAVGGKPNTPFFDPPAGSYDKPQSVTIGSSNTGVTLLYTTNGSVPDAASATVYDGTPITVDMPLTLTAIATRSDLSSSTQASAAYTFQCARPAFAAGSAVNTWTINTATPGAIIRYTLNGDDPTSASSEYTGNAITQGATAIKARAFRTGWTISELGASSGAPTVSITANPASVNNSGSFTAVVADDDSTQTEIQVRWDWENDGVWNTEFIATKTAAHSYTTTGAKTLAAEAKDKWGVTAKTTATFTINHFLSNFPMASIPAGSFYNGTSTVTLSAFTMSTKEITQSQYQAVMGNNPSYFRSNTDATSCPVEQVTWYDAVEFCNKLSTAEGLGTVYTIANRSPATGYPITSATVSVDWTKNGYRLPTEVQWEYAARGGTTGTYYWGEATDDATVGQYAWFSSNSDSKTHAVGQKTANAYGLYDMAGNVWEWCSDRRGSYTSGAQTDPPGPSSGSSRVSRGGSWGDSTGYLATAYRDNTYAYLQLNVLGFRVLAPQSGP